MIAHWDEVESGSAEAGHLGGEWSNLGSAAETRTVGFEDLDYDDGEPR